jgi:hypothetical protein
MRERMLSERPTLAGFGDRFPLGVVRQEVTGLIDAVGQAIEGDKLNARFEQFAQVSFIVRQQAGAHAGRLE